MMTVVVLITILASATIPLATRQLRDRRTQDAAQKVATLYQSARMRAMGRGSAVLVRYTPGTPGTFTVLEAQRGPNDTPNGAPNEACAALPVSSCLTTDWVNAATKQYRAVSTLDMTGDSGLTLVMNGGTALDICFTPMGRTYSAVTGQVLAATSTVYTATVGRATSSNVRERQVLILPNGAARLSL
jgi:type IV fimbrial biogenesis protein FimT